MENAFANEFLRIGLNKRVDCEDNFKSYHQIDNQEEAMLKRNDILDRIFNADCLVTLKKIEDETVDLIVTDPPFNIGKKYESDYNDNKRHDEYMQWCKTWLTECIRILKPHGSLYLFNYPENNAYLLPFLREKMVFKRWMTWHYPTNTGHSKSNFTRSQHSVLFFTKTKNSTFNKKDIAVPYKNPEDKRIKERLKNGSNGRTPYDVFQFNLVKNVSREKTEHICQLPVELIKLFVKASSKRGELVFDPFMGSGTAAAAAKSLGRHYSGCEISNKYCEVIQRRLNGTKFGEDLEKVAPINITTFIS